MWGWSPTEKKEGEERERERRKKDCWYDNIRTDNVCVPKLRTRSIPVYDKCQQRRYCRKSFCNVHIYGADNWRTVIQRSTESLEERSGGGLVLKPFNRLSLLTPLQNEARSFEDTLLSICRKKGRGGSQKDFKNILRRPSLEFNGQVETGPYCNHDRTKCSGWKLEQLKQLENLSLSVIVYVLTFGKTESLNSAG